MLDEHGNVPAAGDIVVSADFRAVYVIGSDRSRRRIKDKSLAERYVSQAKAEAARRSARSTAPAGPSPASLALASLATIAMGGPSR